MVDFEKLRSKKAVQTPIDPMEVFRRLPKSVGINDLYTSQAEVLAAWYERRNETDVVVKLHTGGGKTLVGLLIAQSTLNELKRPVLYLVPTVQLEKQTYEKAREYGIHAVRYEKSSPLGHEFVNASSVMVATYSALFNGLSRFGVRGAARPVQDIGAVILDDAHAAFSIVRDSFTLSVSSDEHKQLYLDIIAAVRGGFKDIDQIGTLDEVVSGRDPGVLEVPYWTWREQQSVFRAAIQPHLEGFGLKWPLLRDKLHVCHALVSSRAFTITPLLPLVDMFPSFRDAPRRIYMSATITDDSEIVTTYGADASLVAKAVTSRSVAGIGERMILVPGLTRFSATSRDCVAAALKAVRPTGLGAVILCASNALAEEWKSIGTVCVGSDDVEKALVRLLTGPNRDVVVLANRYDGIDLPGDACRLLVMSGLPRGASDYELVKAATLHGGASIARKLAQRIEQGIGRGTRGAGDYCVVLLVGSDLAAWIAKIPNFALLTTATQAQVEIGLEVSREVADLNDLVGTLQRCVARDDEWVRYHAESLAERLDSGNSASQSLRAAETERKAFDLWCDGYAAKAIAKVEEFVASGESSDQHLLGWMLQCAARIADAWGQSAAAAEFQRQAFARNRNLLRPKVRPPYVATSAPAEQAVALAAQFGDLRNRRGLLQDCEQLATSLVSSAPSSVFEQALQELGRMLGFHSERHDDHGVGPDVLWLMPGGTGLVIEAKSRKLAKNALRKQDHGQLLVAAEWFEKHYKGATCIRVSVHPNASATTAAVADRAYVLTYVKLARLLAELRQLIVSVCESQVDDGSLVGLCAELLGKSTLRPSTLVDTYLERFVVDTNAAG